MKSLNMNCFIKVKLTKTGVNILKEHHNCVNKRMNGELGEFKLKLDESGYYREQLWKIMNIFGDNFSMSYEVPFESNIIIIEENDLNDV